MWFQEEQESAYQAWLEQKKEERKERRAESRKTGSNQTQNDSCGGEFLNVKFYSNSKSQILPLDSIPDMIYVRLFEK